MYSTTSPDRARNPATVHHPAIRIFERLMRGYDGSAALRLWDGTLYVLGDKSPAFTLVVRDPALLRRLVFERDPLLLADAYFRGALDVEGDLYRALSLKTHFERLSLTWRDKLALRCDAWRLPAKTDASLKPADTMASRIVRRFSHRHSRAATALRADVAALGTAAGGQPEAAQREVDEPTYRVWRLYMAACALEFEAGSTGIYQILASKRNQGEWPVPLSRRDLYAGRDDGRFWELN